MLCLCFWYDKLYVINASFAYACREYSFFYSFRKISRHFLNIMIPWKMYSKLFYINNFFGKGRILVRWSQPIVVGPAHCLKRKEATLPRHAKLCHALELLLKKSNTFNAKVKSIQCVSLLQVWLEARRSSGGNIT